MNACTYHTGFIGVPPDGGHVGEFAEDHAILTDSFDYSVHASRVEN